MLAIAVGLSVAGPSGEAASRQKSLACAEVADATLLAALEVAFRRFSAPWLHIGEDWFLAYALPEAPLNPLLPDKDGRGPPVRGHVWATAVHCRVTPLDPPAEGWTMRIEAGLVRFFEQGGNWSKAIKGGALAAFELSRQAEAWDTRDISEETSILAPGAKMSRPSAVELPPRRPK